MIERVPYRRLILSGAILGLLSGCFYTLMIQDIYTAESTIKIGSIGMPNHLNDQESNNLNKRLIEDRESLVELLYSRFRIHEGRLNRIGLPYLYDIDRGSSPDLIKFSARGRTPDEAVIFLEIVLEWITSRHSEIYVSARKQLSQHAQYIKKLYMESSKKNNRYNIEPINKGAKTSGGLGSNIYSKSHNEQLLLLVAQTELANLDINSYPTEIVVAARSNGRKVKPKPILYILTGLIVGVVAFVVGAGIYREVKNI